MINKFLKTSKAKTGVTVFALMLVLIFIGLNFQNCSNMTSSSFGDSSSTGVGGTEIINPVTGGDDDDDDDSVNTGTETGSITAVFSAGDEYTGQALISVDSFVDTFVTSLGYRNFEFSKAIAIAQNGLGYASLTDINNDDEAERMALESCNLITNLPCALIVTGNQFVINSTDISNNLEYILPDLNGMDFNRVAIPLTTTSVRNGQVVTDYINAAVTKAAAVSVTGGFYPSYSLTDELSEAEARRMAVQQCEMLSALSPCILYSVNNEVVFDPSNWVKRTLVNYTNNNVRAITPPGSRDSTLVTIGERLDSLSNTEKYAISITPNGFGYISVSESLQDAQQRSLSNCVNGAHNSQCIGYADSEGVKMAPEKTQARLRYSELYCKTVRFSCNDHRTVGCPAGSYWVQDPNTLAAEIAPCN